MAPKAKMMSEAANFLQNGVNRCALKTASILYRKNGSEGNPSFSLKSAHLAYAVVQHEEVKPVKYDASLSFLGALDNVVGAQHACDAREDFVGIADMLSDTIECARRANMLIHNKYYCDHRGCK